MLMVCLRSFLPIEEQDSISLLVQRLNGWFTVRNNCVDYYIREDYAYMLHLCDSQLSRIPMLDLIY